jgi:hypothetical protein
MTDAQLLKFVTGFRRGIVGRGKSEYMCFAVCAPLVTLLNMHGVPSKLREGTVKFEIGSINHFWIELEDGRVIDPTADQFNRFFGRSLPKVYLGAADAAIHQLLHEERQP